MSPPPHLSPSPPVGPHYLPQQDSQGPSPAPLPWYTYDNKTRILTIKASKVLFNGAMSTMGSLLAGGSLTASSLQVKGSATLDTVTTNKLTVGTLTAKKNLTGGWMANLVFWLLLGGVTSPWGN